MSSEHHHHHHHARDPGSTGKVVICFHAGEGEASWRSVAGKLGIAADRVAHATELGQGQGGAWDEALAFRSFDLMIVRQPLSEVQARLGGPANAGDTPAPPASSPVALVRSEQLFQRPSTVVHDGGPIFDADAFRRIYGFVPDQESPIFTEDKLTWALQAIGCAAADPKIDGAGVKVAVLDSGIVAHPALPVPADAQPFLDPTVSTVDTLGHGTHCAGLICGQPPPHRPRFGVAPGATLFVARVTNDQGAFAEEWVLRGIQWALDKGCQVISMSLGQPPGQGPDLRYESLAATAARQGALLVAAAGNESHRTQNQLSAVNEPGASDNVMAIGGIDWGFRVYDTSNRGTSGGAGAVDLAAPGVAVMSSWIDQGYRWLDGTSCATPLVAGVAALWTQWARQKGREVTPQRIWELMVEHAQPLRDAAGNPLDPRDVGAGLVQAPAASGQ
jgi:subtilisin family serine protease